MKMLDYLEKNNTLKILETYKLEKEKTNGTM